MLSRVQSETLMETLFVQAMADLFALQCIQKEVLFRNDEYMTPEKMKAIMRLRSAPSCSSL